MTWLYILGAIILTVVIAVAVLLQRVNSEIMRKASVMAKDLFPVWAALGPFKNGTDSAVALGYAYLVVQGVNSTMEAFESFKGHVVAY